MSDLVQVGSTAQASTVASAIAGKMRQQGYAEIEAIGADAVNQAVKAVAMARDFLEQDRIDLTLVPKFVNVEVAGAEQTALHFAVYKRRLRSERPWLNWRWLWQTAVRG